MSKLKEKRKSKSSGDILISKFKLRLNDENIQLINSLRQKSADVWNDILDLHWWLYDQYKIWTDASEKKKWINGKTHNLHSQTIQAIIELHEETCERTRLLRKNGDKNWRYPHKHKSFFTLKYKKSAMKFLEENNHKLFKLSNGRNEKYLILSFPSHIDTEKVKNAEIVFKHNHYYLHIAIEKPKREQVVGNEIAGGDPGEIHALTVSNGTKHAIFTGKELRSLHRLRNKVLRNLSKRISRKKKGSKSFWKLVNRKRSFLSWIERKIEYIEHCISKMVIDWCVENQVATLYIGNPDGVQKNTRKRKNKSLNQKLSNWSFGQLYQKIHYKGLLRGILVEKREESYTSGTCPNCGAYKKQSGRKFTCSCGKTGHRDVVGASNIRDKSIHGEITSGRDVPQFSQTTYHRVLLNSHTKQWCSACDRAA